MMVRDLMKTDVATCAPTDDLAQAGRIMRDRHCGFVPVVDAQGSVAGVLTDRDVCVHAAAATRTLAHLSVTSAMSHPVFSCAPEDDIKAALGAMAQHHVHRLPVLDRDGHLRGVLSVDDVVMAPPRPGEPTAQDLVSALKGIVARRPVEAIPAV
jgi:CBS domain-containing protein